MELSSKIAAVSRMQKYIGEHADKGITLDELSKAVGYSKYHAARMFKELTGKTRKRRQIADIGIITIWIVLHCDSDGIRNMAETLLTHGITIPFCRL